MNPLEDLRALVARFPLPEDATLMDPFVDAADVNGVVIHTVGLGVEYRGECITGSAGSLDAPPAVRAYMELLERLALLSVTPARPEARDVAAPKWRAARSNGVAIGVSAEDAAHRARCELVERDRVLRSWFGEGAPRPIAVAHQVPAPLHDLYDFEACLFEPAHGIHTAGVFGFPRAGAPLVHGFAARPDEGEALGGALDECVQRLGFLWGEPLPNSPPVPEPSPAFHQEHFLYPPHHESLRRWLRGEHRAHGEGLNSPRPSALPRVEILRPHWLSPSLHVARALPRGHVPLWFGSAHPMLRDRHPAETSVHPVV